MDVFFGQYGYHGASFEQAYRCYPASFIDKSQIENGDKVIMPPSALDRLVSKCFNRAGFPLWGSGVHCRRRHDVHALLDDGESVITRRIRICRTSEKCDSSQGLETTLRNFSCLSTGDGIMVAYNNRKYYIDIIETKPSNAICIIETDCEVDFAPPLDYKEPEKPAVSIPTSKSPAEGQDPPAETGPKFNPFTGVARRLDGRPLQT